MPQYFMQNYGLNESQTFNFNWDIINHQSSVVITVSEGAEPAENGQVLGTSQSPMRFIGDALFSVHSVAPHDGGVTFKVEIDSSNLLNLWVCITVFDDSDNQGTGFL
jgi:hypothetical protein